MRSDDRIIYSLNVADLQTIAEDELGRRLTRKEVALLKDKIGDYIGWADAIIAAIQANISNEKT
ncbi:MAG: hypothetical protein ACP5O7_08340 [Phycisphaerae bacterium]